MEYKEGGNAMWLCYYPPAHHASNAHHDTCLGCALRYHVHVWISTAFQEERCAAPLPSAASVVSLLVKQCRELWAALLQPAVLRPTTFLVVTGCLPTAGAAMFFFFTDHLHFSAEFLGHMQVCRRIQGRATCCAHFLCMLCVSVLVCFVCMQRAFPEHWCSVYAYPTQTVGYLAAIGGIAAYNVWCKRVALRRLLAVTTLASLAVELARLMLITGTAERTPVV